MIRVFLALLLVHFSLFSLLSCTSQTTDEAMNSDNGAISDTDLADVGGAAGGEDAVENEIESGDQAATADNADIEDAPAPDENATSESVADDDSELENDLSSADTEESKVAEEQPIESENQELAPETPPPAAEAEAELAPAPVPAEPAPPPEPEVAKVRDIRYLSNESGGTVVIQTSKPVNYQTRMNPATQQFVIEMADVELPPALQRPYQLKEMGSRFGGLNAYQSEGSKTARVVIQLAGNSVGEPVIQQEGTSLIVIPPAAPAPTPVPSLAENAAPAEKPQSKEALSARTLNEFLTGNQKFYGHTVNLQVKDADVRDVINFIAEETGANIVMSDDVNGKVSLKLRKIPWDQALVTIMRAKALGYTRQGNVLRISSLKQLQDESEATTKIMNAQKAIVPAVVRVIPASYANIDELVKNVTPFLSKEGKVVADNRSNTLIVTDNAEVVNRVDKLVKTLDVAPPQVSIESKIVEAVEGFENFVGVNWFIPGAPVQLSPNGGFNNAPISLKPSASAATLSNQFAGAPMTASLGIGTLDALGDLTATLTLAENDSLAKVISAPRISTMNREKATIVQQGENVAIVTQRTDTTGSTITKTEKRTPFTLQLDVTPQITVDGSVIMDLEVQRQFLGPVVDQEIQSRAVNTRRAKTKILVRNGQTAVIGGIYTSDEAEQRTGVPGLMNIPVIGWLFKSKSISRDKNELLIFMTPRILNSDGTSSTEIPLTTSSSATPRGADADSVVQ